LGVQITVVYGTRPEAIKLGPVVQELHRRSVQPTILATGQHAGLLHGTPAETTMAPTVSLGIASANDPMAYVRACEWGLRQTWATDRPEQVIVLGDTASAYAAAVTAHSLDIPVVHVEAGIRSGNPMDPWPEEGFRTRIDQLASAWFCATEDNLWNLNPDPGQPTSEARHWVTGNPGIDALYTHTLPSDRVFDRVLITLHRRESFGAPLEHLISGLLAAARRFPSLIFEWPTHPNPEVQRLLPRGTAPDNVVLADPYPAHVFANVLSGSRAVITDSGGVQEEAAALGIPCCVAREKTDRPESVDAGLAKVIGRTAQGVLDGLDWALGFSTRPDPSHCFGDGHAAPRIVDHLLTGD